MYELKRSTSRSKSNGTPMKMLIAQEVSNEMESKLKPPNLVARLMGLDGLPAQQSFSTLQKSSADGYLQNASSKQGSVKNAFLDKHNHSQYYSLGQTGCKDVHGIWQQSTKPVFLKEQPQHKARHNENANDKKMDLVRQKFIEAKRLATDEKLRQSKEFEDALEILSSNKDLFLKFLQEPNSLFSKHLYELQSIPPPPQSRRITVLKPSKTQQIDRCVGLETKCEKQYVKQHQAVQLNEWDNNKPGRNSVCTHQKADYSSQPTRIVVLKPSPGKTNDIKSGVSYPFLSSELQHSKDFYGESGTDALRGSRDIAKDITRQMQESLSADKRDEALLPFVLSNRYEGDEIKMSENEYIKEGNLSDSESMTPISRHSWDYTRYDSPYSTSSLSRASYASESSVNREAKKRLSERWEMMVSTGSSSQEQRQVRRSSSTLGEMLALSDMKKLVKPWEEGPNAGPCVSSSRSCGGEEELGGPRTRLSNQVDKDEGEEHSPMNLSRSRSVPVSSTAYEKVGLNIEAPDANISIPIVVKEVAKPKSGKSSLKGKVSSLFFSRNKKPSKEQSVSSAPNGIQVESQSSSSDVMGTSPKQPTVGLRSDITLEGGTNCNIDGTPFNPGGQSCKTFSSTVSVASNQQTHTSEASLSTAKPQLLENSSENQDQPSPISVLEVRFEDDVNTPESLEIPNRDSCELLAHLCHKSESTAEYPIESAARTLFLDQNASSETSTPLVHEPSAVSSEAAAGQWFLFVQELLVAAGFDHERSDSVFARWHSPESPLDPSLLEKCMVQKQDFKQLNEAKRRQQRSEYRLLFDFVNAALLDTAKSRTHAIPSTSASCKSVKAGALVSEEVWIQLREWFSDQAKWSFAETDASTIVEMEVREMVVGRGWEETLGLEVEGIGQEIEGKMLDELVEEALADSTCGLLL